MDYQFFCLFLVFIIDTVASCPTQECTTRTTRLPPMNILNRNGKSLPTTAISLEVKVPENMSEGCFINTTNYLSQFNINQDNETIFVFSFRCHKVHPIFITEYEGEFAQSAFGYLQVRYCIIGRYEIQQFFHVTNMLVLTMFESVFDPHKPACLHYSKDTSDCSGLGNMSSLAFTSPPNFIHSNLIDIFNCTTQVFKTSELSLSLQEWTEFPPYLQDKFPNVQTLELEKNNLTLPPNFPWTDEVGYIGHNLSRSLYFAHHYTSPFHVILPDDVFRRYLNLNFNKITDLRKFEFRGQMDMISIQHNNLEYINEYTFTKIKGLQSLDLSENSLVNIPMGTFSGLTDLRNLNIRNNTLTHLHKDLFSDLEKLIKLDLSLNKLKFLPHDVFSRLGKLNVLNLEFNQLTVVPTESFPVLSVNLQEVRLNFNPISTFPVVVFYLRYLKLADLRYTDISMDNVTALLTNISFTYLAESVVDSAASNNINLENRDSQKRLRKIDLTGSKVSRIGYNGGKYGGNFEIILQYFKFVLDKNDLLCDCNIIPFSKWMDLKVKENVFSGIEYFFSDWKCKRPEELRKRPMLKITEKETYCEVQVQLCPHKCQCHQWSVTNITIIDCRNRNLTALPERLPAGSLDLWFQNNSITDISVMEYLARSRDILFSNNKINDISDLVINNMTELRKLYLDSNYLTSLPKSVQYLSNVHIYIKNNPFLCDCKTLWMKSWILNYQQSILDWIDVTCAYGNEEGRQFISVEDDKFVCLEAFDTVKHVIAPSVASSVCIMLFVIIMGSCFIFRLELKVLLFIYFGFHPFDKDEKDEDEDLDCVIIHSKLLTDWVLENVVAPLEADDKAYVVCEIARDFVVGFSYQENICSIVRRSKRMILILSEEFLVDSDIVKIAWNEAQEKIKDMRTNYAIVVCHEISLKTIDNKDLKRYIKRGRYISTHNKLFIEKILYRMPQFEKDQNRKLPNLRKIVLEMYENHINMDTEDVHAFLTYSERDIHIALKTLTPILQKQNYILHVPDRDFVPGASKEENILKAIDTCRHTIFLLSGPYLEDEWSLFTFRSASEKSIRQRCNHMIVVVIDDHDGALMDEEVKYYLKTHVTLHVTDQWFWEKLTKALPSTHDNNERFEIINNKINDQIHKQNSIKHMQIHDLKNDIENRVHGEQLQHGNEENFNNNEERQVFRVAATKL